MNQFKATSTILKSLLAAGVMAGSASMLSAQVTTNILDTFNRSGVLNGSSPDIGDANSGATNWTCNSSSFTTTTANGGALVTSAGNRYGTLPFNAQDGYVYTLNVTLNIGGSDNSVDRWGAVGFTSGSSTVFGTTGPWLLMKQSGHMEAYYNGLTGIYSADNVGFGAGTNNLIQIVLDTTSPGAWTTRIRVNGVNYGPTTTLPGGFAVSAVTIFGYGTGIVVTNTALSVTSTQPTAPVISGQPVGITNWAGVNGTLSVSVSGAQPISYQWYRDSKANPLVGQTSATLSFTPLQGTDSGGYFAVISNYLGSVTSSIANVYAETGVVMALSPTISVGALPSAGADAASGLSSTNTYLCALDFTTTGTPVSINGVNFSPVAATGTSASGVDGQYGGAWSLSTATVYNCPLGTTTTAIGVQTDGNLATLLNDAVQLQPSGYGVQIGDNMTLTFGNVVRTGKYRVRLFYQQWGSNPLPVDFTFNGQGLDETVQLDENLGATPNSAGAYYVDYLFTAAANSVSAKLATEVLGTGGIICGAVLQQVTAPSVAPTIATQPVGFTNWAGYSGSLSVTANGSLPLRYQWYLNNAVIPGQTNSALNFASLDPSWDGQYQVVIANLAGSVTSSVVNVFVVNNGVWVYTPSISVIQIPATGSDPASGIAATNLYLCALDFGSDTTPLAINGVNFTQVSVSGSGTGTGVLPVFSGTDANYGGTWRLTGYNAAIDGSGFGSVASGGSSDPSAQADGNTLAMLTDMSYLPGSTIPGNYALLTFSGLTPGAKYVLNYYYRQWNANDSPQRPIDFTFSGQGADQTVRVDLDGGGANYINDQFTAASTEASVKMTVVNPNNGPQIYGVTLAQTAAPTVPPTIASQPLGFTNWLGYSGNLSVNASGSLPLGYQWYCNGVPLAGQTSPGLSFASLDGTNTGAYKVVITNYAGSITSSIANVLVVTNGVWVYTPSISVVQIPATGSDAASGIWSTNTYLCALHFGGDTTPLAINGVNFTAPDPVGAGTGTSILPVFSGIDPNYGGAWSLTASNSAPDGNGGFDSLSVDYSGSVGSQADGNMQALLTDVTYMPGGVPVGNYARLTFGGLAPGSKYSFRYYYRQWNANDAPQRPINFIFNGQGTSENALVDLDAGGANYINYTFTAAATNLSVTMAVENPGNGPHIYGVTLQQTGTGPGTFTTPPTIGSLLLKNLDVVINGGGAQAGNAYYLLSSTNVTLPFNQWQTVATNVLTVNGNFTFTGTNAVTAGAGRQFYILSNTNYNH